MADLLDQYEQLSSVSSINPFETHIHTNWSANGSEQPIFSKHKIDFRAPEAITHLAVNNNNIVMCLANKTIIKIDLMRPNEPIEIDLSRILVEKNATSRVNQLFVDPSGRHCVISLLNSESRLTNTSENYYNYYMSKKVQQTTKLKGHIISAIAWNYECANNRNMNSTANILIGTTKGVIFETELLASDENKFFPVSTPEQYAKQVFDLSGEAGPITAIEFHKIPHNDDKSVPYFIIVTTNNRLYQFVGSVSNKADAPFLQHIFNTYNGEFQDIPGNIGFSKLDFYYPSSFAVPKSFAWLTEPGVLYGQINLPSKSSVNTAVISDTNLISYSKDSDDNHSYSITEKPISMILTQFHVLVLFRNRLKVICVLNEEVIFEDMYTETYGKLIGIAKDNVKGTVWLFSELAVYRYKIVNEDRNIWQIYLSKKDFNLAKKYSSKYPKSYDQVICEEAQHYFNAKDYEKSVTLYAMSRKSFEEVALKFLQIGEDEALKQFLICKLDAFSGKDKTQLTILLLWLLEILLNQMSLLKNDKKTNTESYHIIEAEFKSILTQNKLRNCLIENHKVVYDLIASHGIESNLIYFTVLIGDYERVVEYYIQHKNYREALNVLKEKAIPDLFYRFSPVIIQEMPSELISVLIQFASRLDATKLIPALVQKYSEKWDAKQGLETIRYLEHCAYKVGNCSPVIHNYLLALYAYIQPDKLMTYLSLKGEDESLVPYDIKYAARICLELGLEKACVHLYSTMDMHEEAVDLALSIDLDLAKQIADKQDLNDDIRKKLWLKIAKHVVTNQCDVKTATNFLKECDLLKIEDLLPFFPDFLTIDDFKDAICSSLQEYNRKIEELKEDMKLATESATEIRDEIKAFRNKYTIVRANDKCVICSYAILTRSSYFFPCGHMFHCDCLCDEMMPYLPQHTKVKVEELRRNLTVIVSQSQQTRANNDTMITVDNSISTANVREKLLSQLEDILANECLYCGEIMINSIDQPFILPEEYSLACEGWD